MSVEHGDLKKKLKLFRIPEFVQYEPTVRIRTIRTYWIPWDPRSGIITIPVQTQKKLENSYGFF